MTQNGQAPGGDRVFGLKFQYATRELAEAAAKAKQQELDDQLGQGKFRSLKGIPGSETVKN